MKKKINYFNQFIVIFSMIVLATACSPASTSQTPTDSTAPTQTEPEKNIASTISLTPTQYNSAPEDPELDMNCRRTIVQFFSFKKGDVTLAYRNLFAQSAGSLADLPADLPLESRTILVLMPASEWWQKNYPASPIPGVYLPEEPGEYIYYVEYTGYYEPTETPFFVYPDSISMIMIQEGPSKACKIKNYGKG